MSTQKLPQPYSEESLFDARVVDRHIAEGRTTRAAYEAYLASLPDDAAACSESDLRFVVRNRPMATAGHVEDDL